MGFELRLGDQTSRLGDTVHDEDALEAGESFARAQHREVGSEPGARRNQPQVASFGNLAEREEAQSLFVDEQLVAFTERKQTRGEFTTRDFADDEFQGLARRGGRRVGAADELVALARQGQVEELSWGEHRADGIEGEGDESVGPLVTALNASRLEHPRLVSFGGGEVILLGLAVPRGSHTESGSLLGRGEEIATLAFYFTRSPWPRSLIFAEMTDSPDLPDAPTTEEKRADYVTSPDSQNVSPAVSREAEDAPPPSLPPVPYPLEVESEEPTNPFASAPPGLLSAPDSATTPGLDLPTVPRTEQPAAEAEPATVRAPTPAALLAEAALADSQRAAAAGREADSRLVAEAVAASANSANQQVQPGRAPGVNGMGGLSDDELPATAAVEAGLPPARPPMETLIGSPIPPKRTRPGSLEQTPSAEVDAAALDAAVDAAFAAALARAKSAPAEASAAIPPPLAGMPPVANLPPGGHSAPGEAQTTAEPAQTTAERPHTAGVEQAQPLPVGAAPPSAAQPASAPATDFPPPATVVVPPQADASAVAQLAGQPAPAAPSAPSGPVPQSFAGQPSGTASQSGTAPQSSAQGGRALPQPAVAPLVGQPGAVSPEVDVNFRRGPVLKSLLAAALVLGAMAAFVIFSQSNQQPVTHKKVADESTVIGRSLPPYRTTLEEGTAQDHREAFRRTEERARAAENPEPSPKNPQADADFKQAFEKAAK